MAESSTHRFKTIYVFGSIEFRKNKEYLKAAVKLDTTLAAQKIDLVYRRGSLGLRGTVVVSTNIGGSKVIGIILKALTKKDISLI